ncbi:hypothetical protein FOZ63_016291 [Perkinsus olseni]|uniref:Uncharacterized protein n=1 Tax=Perkinsus olseni TaxID=32597 RepID=A0A7J6T7X0_PEROL|nr:hypothetical protein FOZ63_016291 [Perkinsus olseni]
MDHNGPIAPDDHEQPWQSISVLISNLMSFGVGAFMWWTSLRKLIPFHPLYRPMVTAFAWVADVWRLPGCADKLRLSVGTTEFVAGALCAVCCWIGESMSEALVLTGLVATMSVLSAAGLTQKGRGIQDILPSLAFDAIALVAIMLRLVAQWRSYPWWVSGITIIDSAIGILVLGWFVYHRWSHDNVALWSPLLCPAEEGSAELHGALGQSTLGRERRHFTPVITPSSLDGSALGKAEDAGSSVKLPEYFHIATRPL